MYSSDEDDPTLIPTKHGHRKDSARKTKKLGLIGAWTLNIALMVAASFLFINWPAFHWIAGSVAWGTVIEAVCLLMLVYVIVGGFCVLGFERRVRDSYLHLHNSPQCLCTSALAVPMLIFAVFMSLSLLALLPLPATNDALEDHTSALFDKADSNQDGVLSKDEFVNFENSINGFADGASVDKYRSNMDVLFTQYDTNHNGQISRAEVWNGVVASTRDERLRFGFAALAISLAILVYVVMYWLWFAHYAQRKIQNEPFKMEGQAGISIPDPAEKVV